MLGPLTMARDGHDIAITSAKIRTVLAYLLVHAGRLVTAHALIDEVWGDNPPPSAANTLQTYISQLRQLMEPDRQRRAGAKLLRTAPGGYLLDVDPRCLDTVLFEDSLCDARAATEANDPDKAAELMRAGLSLWRGPALVNVQGAGAESESARLDELHLVALELRIEADLACGRHSEVVCELGRLVREHPWRERFIGQLMVALYRCGRQAEALERYREARDLLVADLGINPSPELQQLECRLLQQDACLEPTRSAEGHASGNIRPRSAAGLVAAPVPDGTVLHPRRRRLGRTGAVCAVAIAIVLGGITQLSRDSGRGHAPSVPAPRDVIFNEFDLAVDPGVGYDLDIPNGRASDWHATNNPRSPDYDFLDLYRTSSRAPEAENQISGVDVHGINEFNAIHLVADTDPAAICTGLPQHGGGNVKLRDLHAGAKVCLRTGESRWAMITVLHMPTSRAAVLSVHVTVLVS